jgi:D-alanyl-D-alanine dipeptidase
MNCAVQPHDQPRTVRPEVSKGIRPRPAVRWAFVRAAALGAALMAAPLHADDPRALSPHAQKLARSTTSAPSASATEATTAIAPATASAAPSASVFAAADAGLVDLHSLAPGIDLELRYAGPDNFTGARVPGYDAATCWLLAPVAAALARVDASLRERGLRLRVYDCYRPARAVTRFVQWIGEPDDARQKAIYYPNLEKAQLLGDYIAPVSGHSLGASIDLTLLRCHASGLACAPLDMGTPFDFFDPRANHDAPGITAAQRRNRERLREAMQRGGFDPYPYEWWHYRYRMDPAPTLVHDVVIR